MYWRPCDHVLLQLSGPEFTHSHLFIWYLTLWGDINIVTCQIGDLFNLSHCHKRHVPSPASHSQAYTGMQTQAAGTSSNFKVFKQPHFVFLAIFTNLCCLTFIGEVKEGDMFGSMGWFKARGNKGKESLLIDHSSKQAEQKARMWKILFNRNFWHSSSEVNSTAGNQD